MVPKLDIPFEVNNVTAFMTLASNVTKDNPYGDSNLALHVNDNSTIVKKNRERLRELLPKEPFWLNQTHSNIVSKENETQDADASFSRQNQVCAIMTADCVPILVTNKKGNFVAAIHAGWRGLLNGIITKTLNKINEENYHIWLGPCIGPEHFETGKEVKDFFTNKDKIYESTFYPKGDKYLGDLHKIVLLELENFSVQKIYQDKSCTYSDDRFYSYRKNNRTGRMTSVIYRN